MSGVILERNDQSASVRIPMKMKRRGCRKVIIVPDGLQNHPQSQDSECNMPLAAAVAKAHHWQEMFLSGKYATITELANNVGLDRSFVARIMRLALLAPDIVTAIMEGNEPDGLTFKTLTTKPLPICWRDQKKLLKFNE